MSERSRSHSDSISLAGFYYGVIGAFLGAAGIALSVYYSSTGEKLLWLSLSGWISAILIGLFLTRLCIKLMHINGKISHDAVVYAQRCAELAARISELEYARDKLTEISSYVIVTTAKSGSVKPRKRTASNAKTDIKSSSEISKIDSEDTLDDN
jgi:hypothetical protein